MAFDIRGLSEVRALGSNRWAWHYWTSDNLSTVLGANYFSTNAGLSRLHVGDVLFLVASSGAESETVTVGSVAGGSVATVGETLSSAAVAAALASVPDGGEVPLWDFMTAADRTSLLAGTGTDQTAAFTLALAALPTKGGTIVLPGGPIRLNNVITKDGVIVRGAAALSNLFTSGWASNVKPAANASPALTWGDGTTQLRGGCLRDVSLQCNADLSAGTSTKGLLVQGVKSFLLDHCNILGGSGYALRVCGGASSSAVTEAFTARACELGTRSDAPGSVVQLEYNPGDSTSWCEGVFFDGCYVIGPVTGSGYMLDVTGLCDVRLIGGYWQAWSTRGVYLRRKTTGSNYLGSATVLAAATKFDSADSNPELFRWDESDLVLGFHLSGTWKMRAGALARSVGLAATVAVDQDGNGYAFDAAHQNVLTADATVSNQLFFSRNTAPQTEIGSVFAASTSNFKVRAATGKGLILSADGDSGTGTITVVGNVALGSGNTYQINGAQVVGPRATGWTAASGTPNKGAFAADTATAVQTAQRLLAVEQMLRTHGLIN